MAKSGEFKRTGVKMLEISEEQAGQRIDNFLLTQLKGVPKSLIYRILRKGEVRVNRGRIKPQYRLQAGDEVRLPPVRVAHRDEAARPTGRLARLEDAVLYEDKRLLILNKPSGVAVHGGSGVSLGVIEALRQLRPEAPYLELVHRLDRETSGCLIIAKKRSLLRLLHTRLRESDIDKRYRALVRGNWRSGTTRVDAPLLKNILASGERIVRVNEEGKRAVSEFIPIKCSDQASYVEVRLHTGRTHQIRVHAQHMGHPVAGDEKYGDRQFNKAMRDAGLKRMFLHAYSLAFELPEYDTLIKVTAPLDENLDAVLKNLKLDK